MTDIVLRDDGGALSAATQRTFVPVHQEGSKAIWRNDQAAVPVEAQPRITSQWKREKDGSYLLNFKLEVPTQEQQIGASSAGYQAAPKIAYVTWFSGTLYASPRSTPEDRAHVVRMATALLSGADASAAVVNPQNADASGAQVWVNSTKPLHLAFIRLRFPGV
jgi:hypothetical protein